MKKLEILDKEWKSSSPRHGWILVLSFRKRRIVYLASYAACLGAALVPGDRGFAGARGAGLSMPALTLLEESPHYAEGPRLRLKVKTAKDVQAVRKIAQIKLAG